ncbi:MAG: HAD family acid phosphatase [Solirubrobacterales bacterium]
MSRRRSLIRGTLIFLAGALVAGAAALAATGGSDDIRKTSVSDGTPVFGLRPTGVGLPIIPVSASSLGAGDLAGALNDYHDSGAYADDLAAVDSKARSYLLKRLDRLAAKKKRCRKYSHRNHKPLSRCEQPKFAIVLDIDETSISNYAYLGDFTNVVAKLAQAAVAATSPAIGPTLKLYDLAKSRGVAPFFITGRPTAFESLTTQNLTYAGYSGWRGLILNPGGHPLTDYKSSERAKIEKQGYRILVNLGDQESDLAGGHAGRAFKLPNPFYYSP